jgi:hypothetical protein
VDRVGQVILPEMFRRKSLELRVSLSEAQNTVMTDAFLEVLSYRNNLLDLESVADHVRLQRPDGTRENASPTSFGEYVLWRWAEVETIRNTMAQLSLLPYSPVIQIEAVPPDGEPAGLWMYPPSEHLILPRGRGRPRGPAMDKGQFRREYPEIYLYLLQRDGQRPSRLKVAAELGLSERTFRSYLKGSSLSWPPV